MSYLKYIFFYFRFSWIYDFLYFYWLQMRSLLTSRIATLRMKIFSIKSKMIRNFGEKVFEHSLTFSSSQSLSKIFILIFMLILFPPSQPSSHNPFHFGNFIAQLSWEFYYHRNTRKFMFPRNISQSLKIERTAHFMLVICKYQTYKFDTSRRVYTKRNIFLFTNIFLCWEKISNFSFSVFPILITAVVLGRKTWDEENSWMSETFFFFFFCVLWKENK